MTTSFQEAGNLIITTVLLFRSKVIILAAGQDGANDPHRMSLTDHHENNKILAHHIRSSSKSNMNPDDIADQAARTKQLAEIVHYAPLLRLKVRI
jgi:hypothetical protein